MKQSTASGKLIAMVLIGGLCFIASMFTLALVEERQHRLGEAQAEIGSSWGNRQTIAGPMLVFPDPRIDAKEDTYVLPSKLSVETVLTPEVRTRGIFQSVVYTNVLKVSGEFAGKDIRQATANARNVTLSVLVSDTRGIEKQMNFTWAGAEKGFEPGSAITTDYAFQNQNMSGLHAMVLADPYKETIPFAFELPLRGSEGLSVAPVGEETVISIASSWKTPKFVGPLLPSERTIGEEGFSGEWRSSSFGRSYPQILFATPGVAVSQIVDSAIGVDLHEEVDAYDLASRSVKYSILFIVLTFGIFFLFDVLSKIRIHAVQYLLIGSSLALFYLLLLALSEHIGFAKAYLLGAVMIVGLISAYSVSILKSIRRALPVAGFLTLLYGYLYFVLQLEDYALLFGSLLLFVFIALAMYATRKVDWFLLDTKSEA